MRFGSDCSPVLGAEHRLLLSRIVLFQRQTSGIWGVPPLTEYRYTSCGIFRSARNCLTTKLPPSNLFLSHSRSKCFLRLSTSNRPFVYFNPPPMLCPLPSFGDGTGDVCPQLARCSPREAGSLSCRYAMDQREQKRLSCSVCWSSHRQYCCIVFVVWRDIVPDRVRQPL